jgi:hypothetical protein
LTSPRGQRFGKVRAFRVVRSRHAYERSSPIAGLFPNSENIPQPGGYGGVRTTFRVQRNAPFYERLEFFNSELATCAGN